MNILLAGCAGFSPSYMARFLLSMGHNVIGVDNLFLGDRENIQNCEIHKNFWFYNQDARNTDNILRLCKYHRIEIYINMADAAIPYSLTHPLESYKWEVDLCRAMCEIATKTDIKTIVQFSSSEVYGGCGYKEFLSETSPHNPKTPYAAGKSSCDQLIKAFRNFWKREAYIIRPFNLFGPHQKRAIIPTTVKRIMNCQAPRIFGSGEQVRDFVYVDDLIRFVYDIVFLKKYPNYEDEINIASGSFYSIKEIISKISSIMDYKGTPKHTAQRRNDVEILKGSAFSSNMTDFEQALRTTVEWYQNNPNFLKEGEVQ